MFFGVLVVLQAALIYFHSYSPFERESNWAAVVGGAKPLARFGVVALLDLEAAFLLGLMAFSALPAAPGLAPPERLAGMAVGGLALAGLSAALHHNFNAAIVHFPSPRRMAPGLGAALALGAALTAGLMLVSVYFVAAGDAGSVLAAWGQVMGQSFIPAFLLGLLVFGLQALAFFLRLIPMLGSALNAAASTALLLGYFQAIGLAVARTLGDVIWPGLNGLEGAAFAAAAAALASLLTAWLMPRADRHSDGQQPPSLVANQAWDGVPRLVIDEQGASLTTVALVLHVRREPFSLTVTNMGGQVLAQLDALSLTRDLLAHQCLSIPILYTGNTIKMKWRVISRTLGTVLDLRRHPTDGSGLLVTFGCARLRVSFHEQDVLRLTLSRRAEGRPFWERAANAWSLSFPIAAGDHFLGFGQRFNRVDQRGGEVYGLVEEGGVGYAGLAPILKYIFGERGTFPNGEFCTSFPVPFTLMARQEGASVGWFWNTYSPSWFKTDGLAPQSAGRAQLTVLEGDLDLFLCAGPSPLDVIRQYTGLTGRPLVPPPWVMLPWKTRTGPMTETEVLEDIHRYRELDIPLGQVGVENWQKVRGSYEFNSQTYPHIADVVQEAGARGYHIQIWHFPYMNSGCENYRQGVQSGYFLCNRLGLPYLQRIFHGIAAVIDYSNPQAARWHEQIVQKTIYERGFSGTMTDYGESIPPDCTAYNGQVGLALRNAYPVMYCQSMQRAAQGVLGEDYLVYPRAGYAASQRYITAQFPGDQDTDWDDGDGLPAAVRAMLNVSMCGFPVNGSDIGGWFDALTPFTTKELFIRWAEVGACSPLMRTHGGIFGRNREPWKFDEETVEIFRELSQEHVRLFPYLYSLAVEAGRTGWPIAIHPALLWPGQSELYAVEDAWMLGEALYVAPVVRQGATRREVFLPPGDWWDLVRNRAVSGPASIAVDAPLGCTPRFLRRGYPLPCFVNSFDTFMEGTDGRVGHLNDDLEVRYYPGAAARPFALFDGTVLEPDLQATMIGSRHVQWKIFRS